MTNIKDYELKLFKFIDYIYLNNFIKNSIELDNNIIISDKLNNNEQIQNDWKIFSTHYNNESTNILYFIRIIKSNNNFNEELLLNTLHIYSKICNKYAHLIFNYTYLFASVYIAINKIFSDNYLSENCMSQILNITVKTACTMVKIVDDFIDNNDIYFDLKEKENLIENIIY